MNAEEKRQVKLRGMDTAQGGVITCRVDLGIGDGRGCEEDESCNLGFR